MIYFKKIIFFLLLLAGTTSTSWAHGDIKFHLELAMQTSDARGIAAYVEEDISVEYLDVITEKSKTEVEKILTIFFKQNRFAAFKIEHHGTYTNGIRHMEGIYETTGRQKFRIYFEAVYDEKEAHHHLSKMVIEKV